MRHSEATKERIRREYPTGNPQKLAQELGISENQLRTMATTLGVRRSAEAIEAGMRLKRHKISESCKAHHRLKKARIQAQGGLYSVFAQMVNS